MGRKQLNVSKFKYITKGKGLLACIHASIYIRGKKVKLQYSRFQLSGEISLILIFITLTSLLCSIGSIELRS